MFDNIGKKIKILAEILAIFGMVITVGLGLYYIGSFVDLSSYEQSKNTILLIEGLIWLVAGPIVSWIGGFVLYGFGELIDKVCDIEDEMHHITRR